MNPDAFDPKSMPGKLVPTMFIEQYATETGFAAREVRGQGFLPDALPPKLDLGPLLVRLHPALVNAERALSLLEGSARRLTNPHLLMGAFSQREAILSSRIEDTFASVSDVAMVEVAPRELANRSDAQEVRNYITALEHGLRSELPLCLRLIRDMHRHLLKGEAGQNKQPGEFRNTQNAIGSSGGFANARFVPPPPQQLTACLNDFESFMHETESDVPRLIRFAMLHYQFETIHPFLDGNGRLGRLLITLMLCEQGQLTKPLVYVSGFFERHRQAYYDLLQGVSTHGQWEPWIAFFLDAIATQAQDAVSRADRLLDLQAQYHAAVRQKRASPLLPVLIDQLFAQPVVTAASVTTRCDCTKPTAQRLIDTLVAKDILEEMTGRTNYRVFSAPKIMQLIME